MPVIPSFTGFASTPDTAGAFLGGVRIAQQSREAEADRQLKRQQLAQAAAEASARIQFGREQLAARQVENQMELQAKQQMFEQKALQDSQEANIEAAYRNTQFGLAERRLKNAEAIAAIRIQEAAREFERNQKYQRIIDAGGTPEQALREAGPGTPGYSKVVGGSTGSPPMDIITEKIPAVEGVAGRPAEKRSLFGIDWLRKDQPAVEAVAPRGEQTIRRRIPTRGLEIPPPLSNTNSPRRLKYNPKTNRLE